MQPRPFPQLLSAETRLLRNPVAMAAPTICPTCAALHDAEFVGGMCPRCIMFATAPAEAVLLHSGLSHSGTATPLPGHKMAELLGRGGMGNVYRARQLQLDRDLAVKILSDEALEPEFAERFIREAKVLARLEHPNIVPVHELGQNDEGLIFYTMKLVKGRSLQAILDDLARGAAGTVERYQLDRLLSVFLKVCDAMSFAHSRGIIHRDLKPGNIMVGDFGEVVVMDWGLAKVLGNDERRMTNHERESAHSSFRGTPAGSVTGTPQYMAPEQARGEIDLLDGRSDIYALGAILYHILALRPPISGSDPQTLLQRASEGKIDPLILPTERDLPARCDQSGPPAAREASQRGRNARSISRPIPDSLAAVVYKAMAFEMAARHPRVAGLQRDIEAFAGDFAIGAGHVSLARQNMLLIKRHKGIFSTAAAACGLMAALAVWFVFNLNHERKVAVGERNRAGTTLANLAKTAPTFAAQARALSAQGNVEDALEKIGCAVSLDAGNVDYLLQQANLLQAAQKLTEAAECYRRVLALRPDVAAKLNLELCEKLLRDHAGRSDNQLHSRERSQPAR